MIKKNLISTLLFCVVALGYSQKVDFKEFDLDNGLHVILHKDNTAPVVTVGVLYDVGGKDLGGDNNPERTGFAHFFEHLLFEGTENIKRGEWDKIEASNGGSGNAGTDYDKTYYYETYPSNSLETILWMESERMLHPVIDQTGVDTQNEVVKEEKRLRNDNAPYGQLLYVITENLFPNHPYGNKLIGEMEDLDNATLEEFNAFFKKWYGPNNAALVIAGDIDIDDTKDLVKKYFKDIPRGNAPERDFKKEEPITKSKKVEFYDSNIQIPAIIAAYRIPGFTERESYVLNMVSTYLSDGKSSKLYKKLVDENKQALQVQAFNLALKDYGVYALFALPIGDVSLDTLLTEMDEEVAKMKNELISERDYQKILNKFENDFVSSNSTSAGIASSLAEYFMIYGDVNLINTELETYKAITRQEIQDVVKKYLNPNQRIEIHYLPKTVNQ
ncbi:Predicted Zn-dependent peptidase [Flavobacteriaceae bacterium MAR_2010_188]|nr:Predicted Zn-dependent peptidase [Flavobacteriaceae bacterium MAR_2010_188]